MFNEKDTMWLPPDLPDFLITRVRNDQIQVVRYHEGKEEKILVRRKMPREAADKGGVAADVILVVSPDETAFSLAEGSVTGESTTTFRLRSFHMDGTAFGRVVELGIDFTQQVYAGWVDGNTPALVSTRAGITPSSRWVISTATRKTIVPTSHLPKSLRELVSLVPSPKTIGEQFAQSPRWRVLIPYVRTHQDYRSLSSRLGFSSLDAKVTGWLTEDTMTLTMGKTKKALSIPKGLLDWYSATPLSPSWIFVREWKGTMMPAYKGINTLPGDPYIESRLLLLSTTTGKVAFQFDGFTAIPIKDKRISR